MGKIVIDNGFEEYTIEDKFGNVLGSIKFNPADVGIASRYAQASEMLSNITNGIDMSSETALADIEKNVRGAVDFLFNAKVSDDIFSITSPFTPLANGDFFLDSVINAIGQLIESETGKRMKKIQTKINKYAGKYHA